MQPEFRKIIADGDLILQQKGRWWWPLESNWLNYRNESEEVRLLKQHMDNAFMHYKELQRLYIVAQKNVQTDLQLLQMNQVDNSELEYRVPCELSILEERDGIKYSFKSAHSGGGGGSNRNQNQNQKKQKNQHNKPITLLELITQGRFVLPNQQQQAS